MNRILMGAGLVSAAAIMVLLHLLLSARESAATFESQLDVAEQANASQTKEIKRLEDREAELVAEFNAEQGRSEAFTEAVVAGQLALEDQKHEHEKELAELRDNLSAEQRVCADSVVPDAYFMRLEAEGGGGNEVPGQAGARAGEDTASAADALHRFPASGNRTYVARHLVVDGG